MLHKIIGKQQIIGITFDNVNVGRTVNGEDVLEMII
jgi:hypothetical protein